MTNDLTACFEEHGIDYADAMERFCDNEALYLRMAAKFSNDPHFAELEASLGADDVEAAHRASHSLKGVAGNLSFRDLYEASCEMNDALRAEDLARAKDILPSVRSANDRVLEALQSL